MSWVPLTLIAGVALLAQTVGVFVLCTAMGPGIADAGIDSVINILEKGLNEEGPFSALITKTDPVAFLADESGSLTATSQQNSEVQIAVQDALQAALQASRQAGKPLRELMPGVQMLPATARSGSAGGGHVMITRPVITQNGDQTLVITVIGDIVNEILATEKEFAKDDVRSKIMPTIQGCKYVAVGLAFVIFVGFAIATSFMIWRRRLMVKSLKEEIESVAHLDFASLEEGKPRSRAESRDQAEIRQSLTQLGAGLMSLTKYTDPNVARLAMSSGKPNQLGVAEADVTVFFSDIAGFTGMAEQLEPTEFMGLLGTYLSEMTEIIMASNGIVGEFIGDAIMAWWNVPTPVGERHTFLAMHAALKQQQRLAELRAAWCARGLPEVRARMGLVRGRVLAGNIGSAERMKYGLVGDSVNLASRLENLCKTYSVGILVDGGAAAAPGVAEAFLLRPVDLVAVKGRQAPTELLELVGARAGLTGGSPPGAAQACEELCAASVEAHARYRAADFTGALEALQGVRASWPEDVPTQLLASRCEELRPPRQLEPDWCPVTRLDHK